MVEKTDAYYQDLAQQTRHVDGDIEFDEDATVSHSEDGGAYVQAWVWISDPDADEDEDGGED